MKRTVVFGLFSITIGLLVIGCGDPIQRRELNTYKAENRYVDEQELVTQTAFLALESNGKLRYDFKGDMEEGAYASGFLISRNRGLFKTAYHFSEHLGDNNVDWCRLFINTRVYRAGLYRANSSLDSAVLKILDKFDVNDFPEAPPMATKEVEVGDKVFIEGYHPHPYYVRLKDQELGKKFQLIPLLKNYYRTVNADREDYTEIVYEVLEAEVTIKSITLDELYAEFNKGKTKPEKKNPDDLSSGINTFIEIKTAEDHFFSFGGLSGTVVKNIRGEVIGEVTRELNGYGEVKKIIYVTPIESVLRDIKDLVDNYKR